MREIPQVRTQTIRTRIWPTGRPPRWSRCTASAARSPTATAQPLANVWITLPDSAGWTATGADGRFRFDRLTPGSPSPAGPHRRRRRGAGRPRGPRRHDRPHVGAKAARARRRPVSADDRTGSRLPDRLFAGRAGRGGFPQDARRPPAPHPARQPRPHHARWDANGADRAGLRRGRSRRTGAGAIVGEAHRLRPDVVVLDLDGGSAHQLGRLVGGAHRTRGGPLGPRGDLMEVIDPVSDRLAPGLTAHVRAAPERAEQQRTFERSGGVTCRRT